MESKSLFSFLDDYLGIPDFPDYPTAVNGLQVAGPSRVRQVAAAVDASYEAIDRAARMGADLLVVHHGMFWEGLRPVTGRRYRKVARLLEADMALYSAHLPLDAHPEVGNCAVLAREIGLGTEERFGEYQGEPLGWQGLLDEDREALRQRLSEAVEGPVKLLPGGPARIERAALVTGGASAFIEDAARQGLDAFITGEGPHHTWTDAMELGLNVYYAGHYATETWGVQALARLLADRFDLEWGFVDLPTGL